MEKMKHICLLFLFSINIIYALENNLKDENCTFDGSYLDEIIRCKRKKGIHSSHPYLPTNTATNTDVFCKVRCYKTDVIGNAICIDGQWQTDCPHTRSKRFMENEALPLLPLFLDRRLLRDKSPPKLECPYIQPTPADKIQVNAWVYWPEPVLAFDNIDGIIIAERHGRGPGHIFHGTSYVTYIAKDRAGNMNSCLLKISVFVNRCDSLPQIPNGYRICNPVDDNLYGTTCTFGCYDGFELKGGPSQLECLLNMKWSGTIPYCEKLKCKELPPVNKPLSFTCTDANNYRSICTYTCDTGYDIEPGMTRVRVCSSNKQWRGDAPKCKDTEAPKISNCTGAFYNIADRNSLEGKAHWTEPSVSDNSNEFIPLLLEGQIKPGDRISSGVYKIRYQATDKAGNKAFECKMKIVMKVLRCPNIYPTPYMTVKCPSGVKYGARCQFECDVGTVINGTRDAVCESLDGKYSEWTFGASQPYCEMIGKCKNVPKAPKNGALACDKWLGGEFCQLQCKKGYDVKPGFPFYDMLVCDVDRGIWGPKEFLPLPDCATSVLTSRGIVRKSVEYYFSGDCNDITTKDEIQMNFISALNKSVYRDGCLIYAKDCKITNVKVVCGSKKRSTRARIKFDIDITFDNDTFVVQFSEFRRNMHTIFFNMKNSIDKGILDIRYGKNQTMKAVTSNSGDLELLCSGNTIPSYPTLSCVKCSPGTFYNRATCHRCPRGHYQPNSGLSDCIKCPFGQTTPSIGSTRIEDCLDGCQPGYWSPNGIPPCLPCYYGTYIDTFGSNICKTCSGSRTTELEGSTKETDCKEFDIVLTSVRSSIDAPIVIDNDVSDFSMTFWLQQDENSSISISFKNKRNISMYKLSLGFEDSYIQNIRDKREFQIFSNDTRWNQYVVLALKDKVVIRRNETEIIIPINLTLNKNIQTVEITGKGQISQLNIWSKKPIPENKRLNQGKKCFDEAVGDIFSWKIFENSNGNNSFIQNPSECDDTDECMTNPCNNGDCTDEGKTFSCRCHYGFHGEICEENIDDCTGHACENNGSCIDGPSNYICLCQNEFTGDLCETRMINGNWSEWLEWSDCSRTCGNGTRMRKRICNNPFPENGGLYCQDSNVEIMTCFQIPSCPKCSNLTEPDNSTLTCIESENGTINCTLKCNEGFDFDQVPKPYFLCGPDTFHEWDFITNENPLGRLPFCSAIQYGDSLTILFEAKYENLTCDTEDMQQNAMNIIPNKVQIALQNLTCIRNGLCASATTKVTDCSVRRMRSIDTNTAGIQIEFKCDSNVFGTYTCLRALYEAVQQLQLLAMNKSLQTEIQNSRYDIINNRTATKGSVKCPSGSVQVSFYCVPCSPGKHLKNGVCETCENGSYQDEVGQTYCKACPIGRTTTGKGSISAKECNDDLGGTSDQEKGLKNLEIAAMVVGSLLLITITIVVWMTYQKYKQKLEPEVFIFKDSERVNTSKPAFTRGRMEIKQNGPSRKYKI